MAHPHEQQQPGPTREGASERMPGKTPGAAEGGGEERRIPGGAPGKTPGAAEGEDTSRRPPPTTDR